MGCRDALVNLGELFVGDFSHNGFQVGKDFNGRQFDSKHISRWHPCVNRIDVIVDNHQVLGILLPCISYAVDSNVRQLTSYRHVPTRPKWGNTDRQPMKSSSRDTSLNAALSSTMKTSNHT